jgi:hypothetical protein
VLAQPDSDVRVVGNGSGGVWAATLDGQRPLLHDTGGQWQTVRLPGAKGKITSAPVPAESRVEHGVRAGALALGGYPDTEAVIY